jgi:hypothetical protein
MSYCSLENAIIMNSINHDPTFEKSYKPAVADAWDSDEWNYVPLVSLVATTKEESAEWPSTA